MATSKAITERSDEKRRVKIYKQIDLEQLLHGLTLCGQDTLDEDVESGAEDDKTDTPLVLTVSDTMQCSLCKTEFSNRDEQKQHYKQDWHRFNLKQRMKGFQAVEESVFEEITGDISSLSGSNTDTSDSSSSDSEDAALKLPTLTVPDHHHHHHHRERKTAKVYFRNLDGEMFAVYRCVLHGKKDIPEDPKQLLSLMKQLPYKVKWLVMLTGGGHFAAAVFDRDGIVVHKTFHRYTVRAKRGTAQGARDAQGGSVIKSAGASLRRYNEAALVQDIHSLFDAWWDHIKSCDLIFLRAPAYNKAIFFGGKKPYFKGDARVRFIPFPTRRATLKEVKRVHDELATVECFGNVEHPPQSPNKSVLAKNDKQINKTDTDQPQKDRKKEKATKTTVENAENVSDSDSDSDVDVSFVEENISTLDLQEFESTRKPRRRKKKAKNKNKMEEESKNDVQDETNNAACDTIPEMDTTMMDYRNKLFTACKTGNLIMLEETLSEMRTLDSRKFDHSKLTTSEPSIVVMVSNTDSENKDQLAVIDNICDKSSSEINTSNSEYAQKDRNSQNAQENEIQTPSGGSKNFSDLEKDQETQNTCIFVEQEREIVETCAIKPDDSNNILISIINQPVNDTNDTLVHIAASNGHSKLVSVLMENGADPCFRNSKGQLPYNVSSEKETRNEFRRFMARHPDRYDYADAQIPGPLTESMEAEKKAREASRRKEQKKNKKERMKQVKEEEMKVKAEEMEKQRFLNLSDREKRALAAERRLTQQLVDSGKAVPVFSRCWNCGTDITGKVPFEYYDYKFCSPKCLKEHKAKK